MTWMDGQDESLSPREYPLRSNPRHLKQAAMACFHRGLHFPPFLVLLPPLWHFPFLSILLVEFVEEEDKSHHQCLI